MAGGTRIPSQPRIPCSAPGHLPAGTRGNQTETKKGCGRGRVLIPWAQNSEHHWGRCLADRVGFHTGQARHRAGAAFQFSGVPSGQDTRPGESQPFQACGHMGYDLR